MTQKELEKIYNEGYRAVYWTAMALLKNEADAEDVVQDTFVSFIESYGNIEDTTKVVALLKKIAANKSLNRLKSVRTENVDDEVLENLETVPEDFLPDSIVESDAMRKIVMDIIENSLSEDVRRTIILFYFDEMSTKEISDLLGVPQGTVLWRLNFARKKIKKEVEKYEEESNTKLFGMPLPFLTKLFAKEAEQVTIKPMPASLLHLSASSSIKAASAEAGKKIASEAVRKGTGIMIKKVIIALVAVLAAGAVAGMIYLNTNQKTDKDTEVSKKETTEATTEETTEKIPEESTDVVVESTTENTTSEPVATTTEPVDEESEDVIAYPNGGQENASGTVFISFEGKSADEIRENIIEISRTTKDATPENFPERCMVYPIDYSYSDEADEMIFYYWHLRLQEGAEGIDHVNVYIVRNDDGSLNMASRASVILTCQNRERWEELYNTSCDALMQLTGCNSLMKSGSGDGEASHYLTYFVAKDFDENGNFKLHVEIPLIDPEDVQNEA
ncbi:MAG: sigma-70 family RNA polymerase sigma factor [Clostridiales bacterium]|nr:sigma-70 family RNA polymerase sigma factor [Clostridiales bacterium]